MLVRGKGRKVCEGRGVCGIERQSHLCVPYRNTHTIYMICIPTYNTKWTTAL